MHKILILGPQGCGKGTQAALLAKKLGIVQLSMGQLLRHKATENDELANKIREVQATGQLVSDQIAIQVLDARLREQDVQAGYILDGFPRNDEQYRAFASYTTPTLVIVIEVPPEVSLPRLTKRAELEHRQDDTPEIIAKRLKVYADETRPMIKHYEDLGLVRFIDGVGSVEEVADRINHIFATEYPA